MKNLRNNILSTLFIVLVGLCGNANAANVDLATARQIGAYFFNVATGTKNPVAADQLKLAQQIDNPTLCIPALYAFNVAGDGFVVVSASDCVDPVLAYSPTGSIDPENSNPACQYMLNCYARLISDNQNHDATPIAEVRQSWNELTEQTFTCNPNSKASLIQAKWDQGEIVKPSYNVFCPTIGRYYCFTGCVATAMGMIIHYWRYPEKGGNSTSNTATCPWKGTTVRYKFAVDSNKFIYDSMPNKISYSSPWENKRAIGKLLFACGVTVKMDWDTNGSGTQSSLVPAAFSNWFRYSPEATYLQRNGITNAQWLDILHSELDDNARPVYYSAYDPNGSGRDAAGHAFVIAGSSAANNKQFWINWGWGGSSNGYFTLSPATSIASAGGYTFSYGHAMVYRIHPDNVGIDDNTSYSVAPAYPNPATDYLMIPADLPLAARLTVYSADGRMVDNQIIPAGTHEYRLDLQHYAPGAYIYRLNGSVVKFTVL